MSEDFAARLLEEAQRDFPVAERPYQVLADRLGATEQQVLDTFEELVASGVVRELSAFFDPRALGYESTLACMSVPDDRVEEVAGLLATMPEITHNYLREGDPNLWFTVIARSRAEVAAILRAIEDAAGCGPVHDLPAGKIYKLHVVFTAEEMSL